MPYLLNSLFDDVAQLQHQNLDLFGSGRLIGKNLVLTARHVVASGDSEEPVKLGWLVRMHSSRPADANREKWNWIEASVVWTGAESLDLALLQLIPSKDTADWHPKLKLRIAKIDEVRDHRVRGLGFPRGAKVQDKRALFDPSGNLNDQRGMTLSFGIDSSYVPVSPDVDWCGFSGGAVVKEDSPDSDVVWIYGVAQHVPTSFTRQLAVARLTKALEDIRFQALLTAAGVALDEPADPVRRYQKIALSLTEILRAHRADYLSTYGHVTVLGDHPAEVLDHFLQVPYIHRRFDVKGPAEIERAPQTIGRVETSVKERPAQQDESFLMERLRAGNSWVIVEGDGGSGKTEFARHTVAGLTAELPEDLSQAKRVPVFLELRAVGREPPRVHSAAALMASMAEQAGKLAIAVDDTTWFHRLANEGRLVVVLDGLDEFPDPSHLEAFDTSLETARQQFGLSRCSVLVTGRPSAFARTPRLRKRAERLRFQPQPLTRPEVEASIVSLLGGDRVAAAAMIRSVQNSRDSVQRLLRIPLFLTLAYGFWGRDEEGHLLSDAAALMSRGLENLLERRMPGHVSQAVNDLARLAAATCPNFDNIAHSVASRIVDEVALDRYSRDSGILRGGAGMGYRFSIRPLAEYLAGRQFSSTRDQDLLFTFKQHIWSNRWREPLFWTAAELWKNSRQPVSLLLLNRLLSEVEQGNDDVSETLVQRVCDLVGVSGEEQQIPTATLKRLSRVLLPMRKHPDANDRLRRFEPEIGAWPEYVRDHLTRSALACARKTYPHHVVEALGVLRSKQAVEPLLKFLKATGEKDLSHYVIPALGRVGTDSVVQVLTNMLNAPESEESHRELSARALRTAGLPSGVPGLVRSLEDKRSENIRDVIYEALADLGWPDTLPSLLQQIDRERNNPESTFYPQSFNTLVELASRSMEARRVLERLAREEADPYLRHKAATGIGSEGDLTFLMPEEIEDREMDFIAYSFAGRSELAGQLLVWSPNDTKENERQIGTVLATVCRVSVQPNSSGKHAVNRYHLLKPEEVDPERILETLEFAKDLIDEPAALSSVAKAIGSCGSARSSSVLVEVLKSNPPRGVLYETIDALGDPANRDAIPEIKKWLEERDSDDDLGYHAAETLLKIDATDADIVGACIDGELRDVVATVLRHHDHAVFCVPTRRVKARFGNLPMRRRALKSLRGSSCVVVLRDKLRLDG